MQPSRKPRADHTGGHLPAKRRKLAATAHSDRVNQQSLSDLFRDQKDTSSSSQSRSERSESQAQAAIGHERYSKSSTSYDSLDRMYNFPTTKPGKNGVIDLTRPSPPSSSHLRKRSSISEGAVSAIFRPRGESKQLVVKNLHTKPRRDPEQYFQKVWPQLDAALSTILRGQAQHSLTELYNGVENICRQGKSAELYIRLQPRCELYLSSRVRQELVDKVPQLSATDLLSHYLKAWEMWNKKLRKIKSIFHYMDQTYLLGHPNLLGIIEMGRSLFKDSIFNDESLKPPIIKGVMDFVDLDRKSPGEDHLRLLRQSVAMLKELSTYFSDFEPRFKELSEEFLCQWANKETSEGSLSSYARRTHALREQEMTRYDLYGFYSSTKEGLSQRLDQWLVQDRLYFLTDVDANIDLLEDNDAEALKDVYSLLERAHRGADLAPIFEKYVNEEGAAIVFDEQREPEMVVRLLDFKKRLDRFCSYSFGSNEVISNSLHKSFQHFINTTKKSQATWETDNAKPGEMIAKHVDLLLRGGVKAIPKLVSNSKGASGTLEDEDDDEKGVDEDAEINHHLSLALDLFRFVQGKAVFEAFYKKDLARRLLMARSASNDAERNMLGRLKTECGAGFTHNLESMFKDMDLARDEMASYNQLQNDRGTMGSGPDLNVSVLSVAAWPTYPDVSVTIPPAISRLISKFEEHYKQKHTGRKLHWKHALAHCQLKAHYPKGNRKELAVSGFQAIVLLLFNDLPADNPNATISYTDIRTATSLPDHELQRTLQSLACARYRVLTKHPKGRDVHETDTFSYNSHFSDPKTRIKINQIQLKETKEENKETHIRVAADRHFETQAAIVRIMKSRKTIGHAELVAEVIKATRTRGVLELADIKKNIDKLMEKDYMERTEGNNYAYIA